jgi:hypothetical protein
MRFAIVGLMFMTSTVTAVAVAQEGGGNGPPRLEIIVMPRLPVPIPTLPTGTVGKFFQPRSESGLMTR